VPADVIFTQAAAGAGASVRITGPKALVDRVTLENGRIRPEATATATSLSTSAATATSCRSRSSPRRARFTLNGSGDLT
jgi:hypothetical protein